MTRRDEAFATIFQMAYGLPTAAVSQKGADAVGYQTPDYNETVFTIECLDEEAEAFADAVVADINLQQKKPLFFRYIGGGQKSPEVDKWLRSRGWRGSWNHARLEKEGEFPTVHILCLKKRRAKPGRRFVEEKTKKKK